MNKRQAKALKALKAIQKKSIKLGLHKKWSMSRITKFIKKVRNENSGTLRKA